MSTLIRKPPVGARLRRGHPLARALAGGWLLNEGGGNQAYDLSGRSNTGVFSDSNLTWDAGPVLRNPGTSNGLALTTPATISYTAPHTIVMWLLAGPWSATEIYLDMKDASNNRVLTFGYGISTGKLLAARTNSTLDTYAQKVASFPTAGEWHCWALVFDPRVDSNKHLIWIDGAANNGGVTGQFTVVGSASQARLLGRASGSADPNASVALLLIFNTVLTAAQINSFCRDPYQMARPEQPVGLLLAVSSGQAYNETVSVSADAAASAADAQTSHESVAAQADAAAWATDTCTVGEIVTVAASAVASAPDTLVVAEVVMATATAEASRSDTAVFVEAVSASAGAVAGATDSSAASEVVNAEAQAVGSAVDAAQFVDSVTAQADGGSAVVDGAQVSESVSCEATIVSLVADTAIFTEAVSAGAQAECSALDSNAPSEVVSAEAVAAASALDSLICVEAVAVSAGAEAFAMDVAAYGEIVAAQCFGVTTVVDAGVFTEAVLVQADVAGSAFDVIPTGGGLIQAFLLIQKTR